MRAVGIEEAAAVGAELLDDFLRRNGPLRDVCCCGAFLTVCTTSYGLRFCTTPCDTRNTAPTTAMGNKTHRERAHHVHPEVAEGVFLLLRDAADERDRDRDADSG